jgi:hypothetical protein
VLFADQEFCARTWFKRSGTSEALNLFSSSSHRSVAILIGTVARHPRWTMSSAFSTDYLTQPHFKPNGKPSWAVINHADRSLDHSLTFKYPDWKTIKKRRRTSRRNHPRAVGSTATSPRVPYERKQWIGCQIVQEAGDRRLDKRCPARNEELGPNPSQHILSLVLQSAMSSRAGDFKRTTDARPSPLRRCHIVYIKAYMPVPGGSI